MSSDSAIERTRELLNERGVKHVGNGGMTKWTNENGCVCRAFTRPGHLTVDVAIMDASPEQAIAATLGRGTCHDEDPGGYFVCSECGAHVQLHDIGRSYVDEFGKRWYATSHEHGLNYCPNCGRRIAEVVDE